MRRIFPSILSPASGQSPQKDDSSPSSVTQDKECVTTVRPKSPARPRSPFRWGRSSTPRSDEGKAKSKNEHFCPDGGKTCEASPSGDENPALAAARRLAHPGRSIELDLASPATRAGSSYEDDCEEKQVLTVRPSSPTSYFQSAHRMRASLESETTSTAESRRIGSTVPLQKFPTNESSKVFSKRPKSAPRLRMPFSADPKPTLDRHGSMRLDNSGSTTREFQAESTGTAEGPLTMLAHLVTHWQSPGRTRNSPAHARSNSRGSSDTLSTASNSETSFREKSSIEFDDNVPYKFRRDSLGSEKPQVKNRSARSVAEKFAKAIRGGSKSSPKDVRTPVSFTDRSEVADISSNKDSTRALKSYFNDTREEVDENDVSSEIILEFPSSRDCAYITYGKSELRTSANNHSFGSTETQARNGTQFKSSLCKEVFPIDKRQRYFHNDKEQEDVDIQLKEYSDKVGSMYDRVQERSRAADRQLEVVQEELANLDAYLPSEIGEDSDNLDISLLQSRVKELLDQKLKLARQAASEAKLSAIDQTTVKEGLTLMEKKLEFAAISAEREKTEMQAALEEELQRREAEWIARLEKVQMEETRLKGRVRDIAENNVGLQKEMASMAAREKSLREQIRQYEHQLDVHKKKLDDAEKVILQIRESSVNSRKQNMHAEDELNSIKKSYKEKEEETVDLRRLVARLQQLCTDHEKSIQGLWNGLKNVSDSRPQEKDRAIMKLQAELLRLSNIEQGLRRDLEASNREAGALRRELKGFVQKVKGEHANGLVKVDSEYQPEIDSLKTQLYELQEHNAILSMKLHTALREQKTKTDAICELESSKKILQEETKGLHEEIAKKKTQLQEKDKDFKWLETRLQAVVKTNRLLQGIVAKQAAFRKKGSDGGSEEMQCDLRRCLEVSAEQLNQMSERVELMNDKLLERESELFAARTECGKKDVTIQGLEQNLNDTKKVLETRIQRLTGRNEELFRLYNAKEKELVDLQTKLKEETELRQKREGELEEVKEQANDLQEELKVQGMHCVLLREKLCAREVELENQDVETKKSVEDRDVLQKDTRKLEMLLDDATQRVIELEHKLAEKEEKISWLQRDSSDCLHDLSKVKDELTKTRRDRDLIKNEAEELGREALRASAEVEVLKRRVNRLEEDIMVKDGELSILQGNLDD